MKPYKTEVPQKGDYILTHDIHGQEIGMVNLIIVEDPTNFFRGSNQLVKIVIVRINADATYNSLTDTLSITHEFTITEDTITSYDWLCKSLGLTPRKKSKSKAYKEHLKELDEIIAESISPKTNEFSKYMLKKAIKRHNIFIKLNESNL